MQEVWIPGHVRAYHLHCIFWSAYAHCIRRTRLNPLFLELGDASSFNIQPFGSLLITDTYWLLSYCCCTLVSYIFTTMLTMGDFSFRHPFFPNSIMHVHTRTSRMTRMYLNILDRQTFCMNIQQNAHTRASSVYNIATLYEHSHLVLQSFIISFVRIQLCHM